MYTTHPKHFWNTKKFLQTTVTEKICLQTSKEVEDIYSDIAGFQELWGISGSLQRRMEKDED